MESFKMVYITAANEDEALRVGRELVDQKLAACANILPRMKSVYRWKGEIREDDEAVLIVKTAADRVAAVTNAVKAMHSYECPCVVALVIEPGNAAYFDWLRESLE